MDEAKYREIVEFLLFYLQGFCNGGSLFYRTIAPKKSQFKPKHLQWPRQSSDLNPIVNLLQDLIKKK